ncbi:MAG: hypothetical protein K8S54_16000 [Spirochaetia bacterium]|nr:hypothetical protein [Spirochaetia bacterium]
MRSIVLVFALIAAGAGCVAPSEMIAFGPTNGLHRAPKAQPTGGLFTVITQPGYVTEIPRGPSTVRYGYRCYGNYFCIGEKDIGSVSLSSPVVAVFSVDLKSMNYQVYSIYEVVVNGWSRDAWQQKYGSLDSIPASARAFHQNVELNDGKIYANVITQKTEHHVFICDASGKTSIEDNARVFRIY